MKTKSSLTSSKCRDPSALLCGLLIIMAVAAAAAFFLSRRNDRPPVSPPSPHEQAAARQGETPTDLSDASGATAPNARLVQQDNHISRAVCAECHQEIVAAYARSGMSHTWLPADGPIAGDPSANGYVADSLTGYRYRVAVNGNAVFQVEERADDPRHSVACQAKYLVGSGKHAQTMVAEDRGSLSLMPLAWYRDRKSWGLNPGYELQNRRFSRPVQPACLACHGAGAIHERPTKNRFHLPISAGIDCQRCHGNGQQHVAFWQARGTGEQPDSVKMAHPLRMDSRQANDLCLQCHLQGDVVVYRPGRDPLHFAPGDRLRDHRHDLLIVTDDTSQLGVASHGARMLQSHCYTGSQGKLTCVGCHDPHRPISDFSRDFFDRQCGTCHTPSACDRELARGEVRSESGCVACHMPQRASREGIHLVFTDHAIVKHPPRGNSVRREPAVLKPNSDVTLISCWPDEWLEPATLGAGYVLLHETMGPQLPSVTRARALLEQALKSNPSDHQSNYWLGSAWLTLERAPEAIQCLSQVVRADPSRHDARFRLALAHELNGDFVEAITLYEGLLGNVPSWLEPYPRLAQLYLARQQPDAAVRVLMRQLSYQDDALALAKLGLAHRLRGGVHDEAMNYINQALSLDPRLPEAILHRAALYLLSGRNDLARADFQRVLQLAPENIEARRAIDALAPAK